MIKINPDILVFYKDLEKNNNREWFEKQKSRYKALESELKVFNEEVKNGLDKEDDIERVKMFNPSNPACTISGNVLIPTTDAFKVLK